MLYNNIVSFMIHLIVLFFVMGKSPSVRESVTPAPILDILFLLLALVIYLGVGMRLRNLGSGYRNFLSVSLIGIIGLLLWLFCVAAASQKSSGMFGNEIVWGLYYLYNLVYNNIFLDFFGKSLVQYPILSLPFSLIPTIIFFCGLQMKIKMIRNRSRQTK